MNRVGGGIAPASYYTTVLESGDFRSDETGWTTTTTVGLNTPLFFVLIHRRIDLA